MSEIKIRKYEQGDYDQLVVLIIDFQRYLVETDKSKQRKYFENQDQGKQYLDQSIKDAGEREGAIFLATLNDKIIGFVQGIVDRHENATMYRLSFKPEIDGWIGELFVDSRHREQKVATKLIEAISQHFRSKDCDRIHLYVAANNHPARQVYEKLGFTEKEIELTKNLKREKLEK